MSKKSWSTAETCKLIELYREMPLLWNTKDINYKNKFKKSDALKEISNIFHTSSEEIDRKLKNINSQYARERRLYQNLKKSGAGKSFHSKWFGYSLMDFLRDKNKPRQTIQRGIENQDSNCDSNMDEDIDDNEENENEISSGSGIEINKSQGIAEHSSSEELIYTQSSSVHSSREDDFKKPMQKSTSLKIDNQKKNDEIFNMMKSVYSSRKTNKADEFDVFGDLIARKLRALRSRRVQCAVQHTINNVIYDAEMGKYDEPQTLMINQHQTLTNLSTKSFVQSPNTTYSDSDINILSNSVSVGEKIQIDNSTSHNTAYWHNM